MYISDGLNADQLEADAKSDMTNTYTETVVVKCTSALAVTFTLKMTCLPAAAPTPEIEVPLYIAPFGTSGMAEFTSRDEKVCTDDVEECFCSGGRLAGDDGRV